MSMVVRLAKSDLLEFCDEADLDGDDEANEEESHRIMKKTNLILQSGWWR